MLLNIKHFQLHTQGKTKCFREACQRPSVNSKQLGTVGQKGLGQKPAQS